MGGAYDLSPAAAQAYDDKKVPSIFGPLAEASLDRIDLSGVTSVLDVACGSGVVLRAVARRMVSPTQLTGVDLSPAMLSVAATRGDTGDHQVTWVEAPAEAMPLSEAGFDLVLCQQGLQFFPDKPAALAEMRRLTAPGGQLGLSCWAGTPPLFATIARHLAARVSDEAAQVAVAPFAFSDAGHIAGLIAAAGYRVSPAQQIDVFRIIPATRAAILVELLATPNESELRALPDASRAALADAILTDLQHWRDREDLKLPQSSWLFTGTVPQGRSAAPSLEGPLI